ncbi:(2Fe-2S)-binding protein [Methylomicrobium sp. RS1]|jgi:bacterioferritin-associated ferredoxin|uniref:(2Fe-2S)-binding protein n=1 Tax=Candidatus Methylomicrobium oryzae TaxID=2802053 RepID=UPI001923E565|nr:(2Fe-2S)-binding protein [Methylomicrobium sp. RS1]MBL1264558.1 (2Fe-2S)-binding protein [Methylomicrobium sp. RS1]
MYVCVCKAVTDTQIKKAIDNGLCTRRQLFDCLGVGSECGKCSRQVKELLDANKQNQFIMHPVSNQPVYNAC